MPEVTFERFGGLSLMTDPQETGAERAISCLNVQAGRDGKVRTRAGYDKVYTNTGDNKTTALFPMAGDILVGTQSNVDLVDTGTWTVTATAALSSGFVPSFAAVNDAVYFSDGASTQIRKFASGAVSSPAGLAAFKAQFLAMQPLDDRLVVNPPTTSAGSLLYFSDAGTPETIDVSNSISLTPGDDEQITGMAVFGTELFVFKQTKFFVFYGNSTDSTGGAIFNYRMVDAGVGGITGAFATHTTGLYFIANDGVYRTVGGPPQKVSNDIAPVFAGSQLPVPYPLRDNLAFLTSPITTWSDISIVGDSLYVVGGTFPATYQFVLDLTTGQWTVHDMPVACVLDGALLGGDFVSSTFFGGGEGSGDAFLHRSHSSFTDDDGDAIAWHWQPGFYDLGTPASKRVGPVSVWGSGTATVSVFTDHGTTDSNAGSVTLGTSPAIARARHLKTYRGRLFSHKLSGSGQASINRVGLNVRDQRVQ